GFDGTLKPNLLLRLQYTSQEFHIVALQSFEWTPFQDLKTGLCRLWTRRFYAARHSEARASWPFFLFQAWPPQAHDSCGVTNIPTLRGVYATGAYHRSVFRVVGSDQEIRSRRNYRVK